MGNIRIGFALHYGRNEQRSHVKLIENSAPPRCSGGGIGGGAEILTSDCDMLKKRAGSGLEFFRAFQVSALLSITLEMNNASKRHMYNTAISFLMRARRRWGDFHKIAPEFPRSDQRKVDRNAVTGHVWCAIWSGPGHARFSGSLMGKPVFVHAHDTAGSIFRGIRQYDGQLAASSLCGPHGKAGLWSFSLGAHVKFCWTWL